MRHSARKLYSRNAGRKYLGRWPAGLTFAKDFTLIPNGTYAKATYQSLLNADFSIGSPLATFTSTSGNFVINGGYQAITANDDVLKYLIAGNRTAAQETIVIKMTHSNAPYNTPGVNNYLTSTDNETGGRRILINDGNSITISPNRTDSINCAITNGDSPISNRTVVYIATMQHLSPYCAFYVDNSSSGTNETTDDFTNNTFGTSFYIGALNDGTLQPNAVFSKIAFFSRVLSASEIAAVTNLM